MSSRYDQRTTTFSPDGRLVQMEYVLQRISKCATAVGIKTKEGIVLAARRRERHALADVNVPEIKDLSSDKLFVIDTHLAVAAAGLESDAQMFIDYARNNALEHRSTMNEFIPAESLCCTLCDAMQQNSQRGGMRPFAVAFIMAAWDRHHGYQLYQTDPTGNYSAWNAYAMGESQEIADSTLKASWKDTMTLHEAQLLAVKVMAKTGDTVTPSADRIELATLTKTPGQAPKFRLFPAAEIKPLIDEADAIRKKEEEEQERKERAFDKS